MLGQFLRKKGVSVERLAGLCEIQDAGGIMAAAKGQSSRQSQLSRQVKELEDALGLSLLDRRSSPSRLSEDGVVLARLARRFFTDFDRIAGGLCQQDGPLRIAANESLVLWYLMPMLGRLGLLKERAIQLLNKRSRDSSQALAEGQVDLAVSHSLEASPGIEVRSLAGYGLRLVGLSGGGTKKWKDLKARGVATLRGDGKLRKEVDRLIMENPDGPSIRLECSSHMQILVACETLGLIGVVPEIALVQVGTRGLPYCRVEELENVNFAVSCGWNKERANKDPTFLRVVNEILK